VGSGDVFGMDIGHSCASGMNGLRAAGDLVVRMQMSKGMKLKEAKAFVAGKLGVTTRELSDPLTMHELRGRLRLGRLFETETTYFMDPSPLEAKWHISELLGVPINSVTKLRAGLGL
jgi:dimethylamine--corrinoid protein Co-methyltransferase